MNLNILLIKYKDIKNVVKSQKVGIIYFFFRFITILIFNIGVNSVLPN